MYDAGLRMTRTDDEKRDMFLNWAREDKAFFASGACHILAHQFISLHPDEDYELIYLKPTGDNPGNHFYVSNGTWAFDFNGWTLEQELLDATLKAYQDKYPDWDYERFAIEEGLIEYLKKSDTLRPPEYFPELPWKRAYNYIKQFSPTPPGDANQ